MWEPRGTLVPTHVNIYFFLKNVLQINQNWTKFAENVRKTHTQIAFFQNTKWNPLKNMNIGRIIDSGHEKFKN